MSHMERLYWIDAQIRQSRYPNAEAVSRQFDVSKRTAFADRDALIERLHAPLKFDRNRNGWIYSDKTYVLPFLALSDRELGSLRRSLLTAQEYLGPDDSAAVSLLLDRLTTHAPQAKSLASESVGGSMHNSADTIVSMELMDACQQAIARRQRLHIEYYGAHRDETRERTVHPYHLHNHRGEWHLIAWCEWRKDIRQFYLGRIRNWKLLATESAFQIDRDFDATTYLSHGFGLLHGEPTVTVKLRFSATQSRWIRERVYHPSQRSKALEDGRLEVTLDVAGISEVLRWILSFGAEVEVLEPSSLRQKVIVSAKNILNIYGMDG